MNILYEYFRTFHNYKILEGQYIHLNLSVRSNPLHPVIRIKKYRPEIVSVHNYFEDEDGVLHPLFDLTHYARLANPLEIERYKKIRKKYEHPK